MAKKEEKKKNYWKIIIPIAIVVILIFWFVGMYNGLVSRDEGVKKAWGDVQSVYQRRADLIPNLVETVRGYRDYERETLESIVQLRTDATQAKIDVDSATTPEQLQAAMGGMDSVLSKLLVVVERYPDLKASQNFLALQDQLEGTENRISVERQRFNDAVRDYNIRTRRFPTNIVASMFGFTQKEMFSADAGAEKVVKVEF
jgi:LemA protein